MDSGYVDEREDVQKKTFAKWINSQLVKTGAAPVQDLFDDLRDGEVLLSLLEILTAQRYKRERGRMRVHHLNNVNTALAALEAQGVRLVNIAGSDVVDGNPKLILGLVWSIILHWQVQYHLKELMSELQQTNLDRTLLAWCRLNTQNYSGVKVTNFTSSWSDGLAFNALLHRWRPHLFDYNSVLSRSPAARLDHAFTLAHQHLGIDRLLDPEDVNCPHPDKKSIMMYLMCLFQSLPHSSEDVGDIEQTLQAESTTPVASQQQDTIRSRPVSTATTGSAELGGYGAALEDVLTWLLEAEERLAAAPDPPADDLDQIKQHFHTHEKFLLELSEQQGRVGGALDEGARLLAGGGLSGEEAGEVRLQMRLLGGRWDALRRAALSRQTAVHATLQRQQQLHRERFRQWLTQTEDRISHLGALSGAPQRLAQQLNAVSALHDDLRAHQPLVDALADCVVVVDDDAQPDNISEIEDELRALGERWSTTCSWTLQQVARLRALHARWSHVQQQYQGYLQQTEERQHQLTQMEASPASEIGEVLTRIKQLQQIKHDISLQQQALTDHLDDVRELLDECGGGGAGGEQYVERVEALADRLEAMLMIVDVQAQRIKSLGFEVNIDTVEETSTSPAPAAPPAAMDVEVTRTITTTMTLSQPTSPLPPSSPPSSHKKPRLSAGGDFQAGYLVFREWADVAEEKLDKCKTELEGNKANRKQTTATLDQIDNEIESQRADFAHVEEIQRRLSSELGLEEEAKQHAQSIDELKKRWERIQQGSLDLRNTMNLLEDKDNFYKNVQALQAELDDVHTWQEKKLREKPTNNQLIHLRNKIRHLKQLEMKLKELNAQSIILLTKPISNAHKNDIESDSKRINDAYEQVLTHLTQKEGEIKLAVSKRPGEKHEEEFKNLQNKIQSIETRIVSEHAMMSSVEEMNKKIEDLHSLRREFMDLQTVYDGVVKERREKYEKGSVEELSLRSSLENLVFRFGDTKTILDQKIGKLEQGLETVSRVESCCGATSAWLQRMETFLQESTLVPLGDVERLELLLDTSNKLEEEKPTYKQQLEDVASTTAAILEDSSESLASALRRSRDELRRRFESASETARERNEQLRRALERTETLFRQIEDTESFLLEVEKSMPREEECNITDSAELYQMKSRFQALKDKCDERTTHFRDLNEQGNDILLAAEDAPPKLLSKRLTQLNARWTHVTHLVYERYKVLAEAWLESGELRSWLAREAAWLDGLRRRLRRSPNAPADIEEITTDLYDLESYIGNHSSERLSRIQDIGRQLIDAQIMPRWIQAEIDQLVDTWTTLQAEAATRTRLLERSAHEASRSEVSIDNLQQWLADVTALLHDRLNQGLTAADLPPDQQRLSEEFESQRSVLEEVTTQVQAYRDAGKLEAAARLQEQLELIFRNFTSAQELLARFGAGAGGADTDGTQLERRLARAQGSLRDVQQAAACLLQLAGPEPDAVRAQLRHCLRFYRTLSEIKSEVESIIKTGRRMVEDKSVSEPLEFSYKIDALKELYNKLGAQITDSKTKLENALITARELQNDLQSLSSWLDGLDGTVGKQTLELEMSRMEAIKDKLNANHVEFAKLCDPVYLDVLRDQVDAVNKRWEHLKKHGNVKREGDAESLQKYLNEVERQFEEASPERLRGLESEVRGRGHEVDAADNKALRRQWEGLLEMITSGMSRARESPSVGYENVTDTIKRRLESPVDSPELERLDSRDIERPVELKKSKIPLALKSPVPIRREIQQGGSRSSSLEREKRRHNTDKSADSTPRRSLPATPDSPRKNSSTFNLLQDSDLFTQISKNKIVPKPPTKQKKPKSSPCHVVEVKEHEIVKSSVTNEDPATDTADANVMHFVPRTSETGDAGIDSDNEDIAQKPKSVDLGTEPKTFVVEVKKLEQRMKPTLGILKRKNSSTDEKHKVMKVTIDAVPDIIPDTEKPRDVHDGSMSTPPPTPMDEGDTECPLMYDLAVRQKEAQKHLLRDEVNEYLILDEVPKDHAALPEPSVTELVSDAKVVDTKDAKMGTLKETAEFKEREETIGDPVQKPDAATSPPRLRKKSNTSGVGDEEVIYTEVEDSPQARVTSSPEPEASQPLSTSTPMKQEERGKQPVHVVAMSPKLGARDPPAQPVPGDDEVISEENKPTKCPPPSPVPRPAPSSPQSDNKSHVGVTRERRAAAEKYQRTDDTDEVASPPSPLAPPSPAPSGLRARFSSECDSELVQWEEAATLMSRRLDVALLTVGGVAAERDPGKRLEILKNQLGALAPDAASLISRGDSLVYSRHKQNPLLADYIQAHYQDKLRNKWSQVMSEIESRRVSAMKAEDDLKELGRLQDELADWLRRVPSDQPLSLELKEQYVDREQEMERVGQLCKELKSLHVGYPEKSLAELHAHWARVKDMYDASLTKDKKTKPEGVETVCSEQVRKVNVVRESVSACARALHAAPLSGNHYDEFPLQEDKLAKVKSSLAELQPAVEDTERECVALLKKCRKQQSGAASEQLRRVADKLRDEWQLINKAYKERHERWSKCQSVWAELYSVLEAVGAWLDSAARALDHAQAPDLPHKDLKQKARDLDKQMSSRERELQAARRAGRAVVSACAMPLARDVQEQLDVLNERWLQVATRLHTLKDRIATQETSVLVREGGAAWLAAAGRQLRQVDELLQCSANPSDLTSLSIRLSLVKAREEELSNKLQEMEVLRKNKQLPPRGEHVASVLQQLYQTQGELSSHRSAIDAKLSALHKYTLRLQLAGECAMEARAQLALAQHLPMRERDNMRDSVAVTIKDKESEIKDILENYNNIERECVAAKQTVSPEIKERVLKLKEDWAHVTSLCSDAERPAIANSSDSNESAARASSVVVRVTSGAVRAGSEAEERRSSEGEASRKSSVDSSASDWSGRGSRRRASQQSAAVILATFDTSVLQIRDWLTAEEAMLRAQAVVVGDLDEIQLHLDKQKGVLRELEQKKPQLDELLHTAESLKGTENRQQLHGKGASKKRPPETEGKENNPTKSAKKTKT